MTKTTESDLIINQDSPGQQALSETDLDVSLSIPETSKVQEIPRSIWRRIRFEKIGIFFLSLYLFVLAIMLMKDGAQTLAPWVQSVGKISNSVNCLGFGWVLSYIIMSGSPVAAAALTFFGSGAIDKLGAFSMITGSRMGAGFVVLLIGFLYVVRGRNRATSLSMGLLTLFITWSTYLPAYFLGIFMLETGFLDSFQLNQGTLLKSSTEIIIGPITNLFTELFPGWLIFLVGLGAIYLSLNLFDRCLPQVAIKESHVGWASRLVYRPAVMFAFGALVTLLSLSVSVSLGILVPLSSRGFIRRENVIPYIMGANITTFIDTLLAAVLLGNPQAFTVVLIEMLAVTIISLVILLFFYPSYQKIILRLISRLTNQNLLLVMFLIFTILTPLIMIFL